MYFALGIGARGRSPRPNFVRDAKGLGDDVPVVDGWNLR